MTVSELIKALQRLPQDVRVELDVSAGDGQIGYAEDVYLKRWSHQSGPTIGHIELAVVITNCVPEA